MVCQSEFMTAEGISVHVFEIKLRILCNGKHAPPFLNSTRLLKLFIRNTRFELQGLMLRICGYLLESEFSYG